MNQKQRKKRIRYVLLLVGMLFVSASLSVESQAAAKRPSLSQKRLQMIEGKQDQLSVKHKKGYMVSWKSSKKAVATVSKNGKVKAKKSGSARITAVVKPDRGGKTYSLICKVSVKRGKKQVNAAEEKTDSAKNVDPSGKPTVSLSENPGSIASGSSSVTSAPSVSDQPVPVQPTSDPAVPDRPTPGKPSGSTTGSAVIGKEAKLLFGNYNDGLRDSFFLGNQMIVSYEQLQDLIREIREDMENDTRQGELPWYGVERMQWFIQQLEAIEEDYFSDHVLCITTMSVARGYDYTLDMAGKVVEEDGTKALHLCLKQHYNLEKDECVTCDMSYYSYFIQLPRDLVQDCESVVCSLVSDGERIPSDDPDDIYMILDVLRILDQICYPLS